LSNKHRQTSPRLRLASHNNSQIGNYLFFKKQKTACAVFLYLSLLT